MAGCKKLETVPFAAQWGTADERAVYIARAGLSSTGKRLGIGSAALAQLADNVLSANRLIYCKQSPGDCGTPTQPQVPGAARPLAIGAQALSTTAGVAGLVAPTAAITAGLGVATAGVGLLLLPIFAIFGHHAQAVAIEQDTLCQVSLAWDGFALAAETFIPSGELPVQDALQQLDQAHQRLVQALAAIEKPCNAACGYHRILDALKMWNAEFIFPRLQPGLVSGLLAQVPGGGKTVAAVGGAIVGAKLLRVF